MVGGARPDGPPGDIGGEEAGRGHGGGAAHRAAGAHGAHVPLTPSGALCDDGGASTPAEQPRGGDRGADTFPCGDGAAHHDEPRGVGLGTGIKVETEAEPEEETEEAALSAGPKAAAVGGATASTSPISGTAVDGGATRDASDGPLPGGATGEDDDLPSFFPTSGEALSPSEPEGGSPGVAAAREPGCEESAAHGRAAHFPSGADAEQLGGVGADGAQALGADADGSPSSPRTAGASVSPHGVVSPPAVTAFGGDLFDPAPGAEGNANISHPVPLDSDSDSGLEVSEPTTAAANGVSDAGAPDAGLSPHGLAGARR